MSTMLTQPAGKAAGMATLRVKGTTISDPNALEIAIIQFVGAEKFLDPRHPDAPWTPSAYWFRPVIALTDGTETLLDIDYGVTFHLRANQPYKLMVRLGNGSVIEERFTCPGNVRKPTFKPQGWAPPPPPRGPLVAPTRDEPAAAPEPSAEHYEIVFDDDDTSAGDKGATSEVSATHSIATSATAASSIPESEPRPAATPATTSATTSTTAATPKSVMVRSPARLIGVSLVTAAMLLAAGAWWVWPKYCCRADTANVPADTSDTKKIAPDKVEAPKAEELSLDSVRKFIASKPPAADAIKMAQQLTESNKLLDAQFLLLRYAAEQGDASAARKIGRMYDPSTYTKETSPLPGPNPVQAAKWHKVAAESGDVESQYRYGMLLKNGGTDEDGGPEKAVFWLQRAAAAGHDGARKELEQK